MVKKKISKKSKTSSKKPKKSVKKKVAEKSSKPPKKKAEKKPEKKKKSLFTVFEGKYFYGLGRRKTSVSQVRIYPKGKGEIFVNGKELKEYGNDIVTALKEIKKPLEVVGMEKDFNISIKVRGGGASGQLGAIQLGFLGRHPL